MYINRIRKDAESFQRELLICVDISQLQKLLQNESYHRSGFCCNPGPGTSTTTVGAWFPLCAQWSKCTNRLSLADY